MDLNWMLEKRLLHWMVITKTVFSQATPTMKSNRPNIAWGGGANISIVFITPEQAIQEIVDFFPLYFMFIGPLFQTYSDTKEYFDIAHCLPPVLESLLALSTPTSSGFPLIKPCTNEAPMWACFRAGQCTSIDTHNTRTYIDPRWTNVSMQ